MATKMNTERAVEAREALTRALKLARALELELGNARGALEDMDGEKFWLGQFWSGALWMLSTTVQEVSRKIFHIRKDTWESHW